MRKLVLYLFLGVLVVVSSAFSVLHTSGYALATGSPHDGTTCAQCHTSSTGSTSVTVVANPALGLGNTYLPGATYTMSAIISGSFPVYGFDLEMLNSNTTVASNAGVCGPVVTSNCQKVVFSSNPTNYTHTAPSGSGNSATFSFQWTAPASGPVYIYCAGLGANNDGTLHGDKVATYSVMLSPSSGIDEYEETTVNVLVSPNPAQDRIVVQYDVRERSVVQIVLCDLKGEEIGELLRAEQPCSQQKKELRLPPGLPAGAYFVKISLNGKSSYSRLITY